MVGGVGPAVTSFTLSDTVNGVVDSNEDGFITGGFYASDVGDKLGFVIGDVKLVEHDLVGFAEGSDIFQFLGGGKGRDIEDVAIASTFNKVEFAAGMGEADACGRSDEEGSFEFVAQNRCAIASVSENCRPRESLLTCM